MVIFVKSYIVELSVVAVVVSSLEKVTTITTFDESSGIAFFSMAYIKDNNKSIPKILKPQKIRNMFSPSLNKI